MTTTGLNTEIVDKFILEVYLIDPLQKIINGLNNREFRDCDINWLDKKLAGFVEFACETLSLKIVLPDTINGKVMNDYTHSQYLTRFNTLLDYFKDIIK